MSDREEIMKLLEEVSYPGYSRDIVSFGMVKEVSTDEKGVLLRLKDFSGKEDIRKEVENRIKLVLERKRIGVVKIVWESETPPPQRPTPFVKRHIEGVKKVVAIASGKGGVGKSTVTVNLTGAMLRLGLRPAILDADIYGPNIPTLLKTDAKPFSPDGVKIIPVEVAGIQMISIGFFVKKEDAVIWRGPLVMKAIQQFVDDTVWKDVDVLFVDLPPGTGDAQLTLVQNVYVDGAVIVTTPEEMAVEDARRAHTMFLKVDVPVIGIIENMSYFRCPECGHVEKIFDSREYENFLRETELNVLAKLPMATALAKKSGLPLTISNPDSEISKSFMQAGKKITEFLLGSGLDI